VTGCESLFSHLRSLAATATPGPWQSWAQGNQNLYAFESARKTDPPQPKGISRYLPTAKIVGAAIIPQLARPWNPHAVMAFGTMDRAWQARFRQEDADYIAALDPQTVVGLLDEIERLRSALNRERSYRESQEGLPEGTLPRV
jgi:hypothetical protein